MSSESHAAGWAGTADRPRFVDPPDAFESVHDLLGRKWHLRIVYHLLADGPLGFSDLKDAVDGVSSKMLAAPDGEILGCHVLGYEASTVIHEAVVAMRTGSGHVSDITDTIHAHPTLNKVVEYAFEDAAEVCKE